METQTMQTDQLGHRVLDELYRIREHLEFEQLHEAANLTRFWLTQPHLSTTEQELFSLLEHVINSLQGVCALHIDRVQAALQQPASRHLLLVSGFLPTHVASWLLLADQHDRAAQVIELVAAATETAGQRRNPLGQIRTLRVTVDLDMRAGRWRQATVGIRHAHVIASSTSLSIGPILLLESELLAARGDTDRAKRCIAAARRESGDRANAQRAWRTDVAEAFTSLCAGEYSRVIELLRPLVAASPRPQDAGGQRMMTDFVEALVRTGNVAEARTIVEQHRPSILTASALAHFDRSRALVASDPATGAALALCSAEEFARMGVPFERGRSLLVAGELLERSGDLLAARRELSRAGTLFDVLRAQPWLDHVQATLTVRNDQIVHDTTFTRPEHDILQCVTRGLANRDIAKQLHMSVKTVEANLTRMYRKLGVTSRTQIVALAFAQGHTATNRVPALQSRPSNCDVVA
jgi:DNA-binding CsgD family transcriptional regulator